jgi:excisionase family DNA binding protein
LHQKDSLCTSWCKVSLFGARVSVYFAAMDIKFLFQLSLEEAGCFIEDCIHKAVVQALQQGTSFALPKQAIPIEEELIDTKDVCKLLGITRVTCDAWRKAKKLPYKRIGARIRFNKQEVLAALQAFNRRANG